MRKHSSKNSPMRTIFCRTLNGVGSSMRVRLMLRVQPKSHGKFYKDYAGSAAADGAYENHSAFTDFAGAEDIFAELFRRRPGQSPHVRGQDQTYRLLIEFLEAINGATKRVTLPGGGILDVAIPAGFRAGQILRLRGKGVPSDGEGQPGDALVEVSIKPHPYFVRQGDDIHVELPITLAEAVLRRE